MEMMGKQVYYCVSCGEEIKPDQIGQKTMVSLSYAALDGASETMINLYPVYVTREELAKLVNRTDAAGRQYLTLSEYLEFAYNRRNRDDLNDTKAENAQVAQQMYHDSAVAASMETEADFDEEEIEHEVVVPGFNETASAQIIKNFPNDICYLEWKINDSNGYFYHLTEKSDARKKITPYWVCAHCREEVLGCAFEYRHILIGLLGFPSAGKTCLIAALCHTLLEQGGILIATKKVQREYEDMLADYKGGYTLAKTDVAGMNTYHPSVQKNNVLWTFVDIPGEVFYEKSQVGMNMEALTSDPKMQMSLKCHAYILTADQDIVNDGLKRSNALNTFEKYINFAEEFNAFTKKGIPLVFALTKVDEVSRAEEERNLPSYCIENSYPKRYRTELSIINNKGLSSFVDTLSKKNYLFATTCAPYGFSPLPQDDPVRGIFPTRDHKEAWIENYMKEHPEILLENAPHPVYRAVSPRNVGMIMDWLEKLFGISAIPYDSENEKTEKRDLSQVSIYDGHFEDVLVTVITCMFSNPSEWDYRWYNTIGDSSILKRMKQDRIKREFTNQRSKRK